MKSLRKIKIAQQISLPLILWIVCFASLLCGSGVGIVMLKNHQIQVRRDIDILRNEINSCEKTTDYYEYKITANSDRWAIRDRLMQNQSALVEIHNNQLEYVNRIAAPAVVARNE